MQDEYKVCRYAKKAGGYENEQYFSITIFHFQKLYLVLARRSSGKFFFAFV
jgi:hypothetical protein